MTKRSISILFGIVTVTGGVLAAGPAHATKWKYYRDPNKCLSVAGDYTGHGHDIVLWACKPESWDPRGQGWSYPGIDNSFHQIQSLNDPSQCLALGQGGSTNEGNSSTTWECSVATADQFWMAIPVLTDHNGHWCYKFVNKKDGSKVLAVTSRVPERDGDHAVISTSTGATSEYWCAY